MSGGCNLDARYRFATYEVDLSSGELLKAGYKVKLQPQPFQVLVALLERPGEVVTREELRARVWPSDAYGDFDHGLNKAVNKIREALGDSSDHPRYVETMARRGYRFIAPVEQLNSPSTAALEPAPQVQRVALWSRWPAWLAVGCIAAAALAAGGVALRTKLRQGPVLTRLTADAGLTTDPAFAPDGKLLAYASDRGSTRLHIWVQQLVQGGPTVQLTHGDRNDVQPAFSPDGTKIVYRSEGEGGGIYVVPAIGGTPVLIANEGRNPSYSPDGKWIAYWSGRGWVEYGCLNRGEIFRVPTSGGPPIEVKTDLRNVAAPLWSLDGQHLLILGERRSDAADNDTDWWVVPAGGGTAVPTGAFADFRRQGMKLRPVEDPMPFPREWTKDGILFSARLGDGVDLWQVPITMGSWQIEMPVIRLSSVAGLAEAGAIAQDGRVAFANVTSRAHLWSLRAEPDRGVVHGPPEQITDSDLSEVWPSVSLDGRVLAYCKSTSGNYDIWVKDLSTGEESALAATEADEIFPRVSNDGRTVAYSVLEGSQKGVYVASAGAPRPRRVTERAELVHGVSPDGRYLLLKQGDVKRVSLMDANSGTVNEILQDPVQDIFQSNFSPDGHWIAFMDVLRIMVASFHGPGVIPKQAWILVTSGGEFDDKPRWSPNGNWIYFTSDRDGFRCLWAQRLNAVTKTPVGAPQVLYHLHDPRKSIAAASFVFSELALARDRLIFPLGELTGNIWMVEPHRR